MVALIYRARPLRMLVRRPGDPERRRSGEQELHATRTGVTACRVLVCLCLTFCVAAAPRPGFSAEVAKGSASALAGVAALNKPITLTEAKIPLGELVHKVAIEAGVKLAAAREVADEPVAVVVRGIPARGLLTNLAELLDYRWRRLGHAGDWRYEIWQDPAGKSYEQALRRALAVDAEKRLQEEVAQLAQMASLPQEQIETEMEAPFRGAHSPAPAVGVAA